MDTYQCTVKAGTDGLTHVPKVGLPAAEVVILQFIHGSDKVVDIQPYYQTDKKTGKREVIQFEGGQFELRDMLTQRYGDKKVVQLWGDPLAGRSLPEDISGPDGQRIAHYADLARARNPDSESGKRIAGARAE